MSTNPNFRLTLKKAIPSTYTNSLYLNLESSRLLEEFRSEQSKWLALSHQLDKRFQQIVIEIEQCPKIVSKSADQIIAVGNKANVWAKDFSNQYVIFTLIDTKMKGKTPFFRK